MKKLIPLGVALVVLCQCTPHHESATKYIMHSGGLFVGRTTEGVVVLTAPENEDQPAAPLTLMPQTDGSYVIGLIQGNDTAYLGVGDKNAWSTFFLPDTAGLRTRYALEKTDANTIKLRNLHTGKYLGTDGTGPSAPLYSDKSGTEEWHTWTLTEQRNAQPKTDTLSYVISTMAARQPIEGWGISLCWWARMCGSWSEEKTDSLIDWMVSPEGLNWNIFRYNIGGGDDPRNTHCEPHHMGKGKGLRAEMEGFLDERNGTYHWDRDAGQRRIMLKIKERRPDAIFEAFSNSAPWWMTVSGCCGGHNDPNKDNLKPEYYKDFAEYLVNVCRHYKDKYGIEFKTLEPFNEPVTDYWYANGSQEGCHFSTEEQVKFLRILHPILKASGLRTVIASSDETDTRQSVKDLLYYQKENIMPLVGQWNTHTYGATNRSRSQVGSLARSEGKTIWMDEVGAGGKGLMGNLNLCQKLFDDMHYILPAAWIDWQYVEEHNDQWCLVQAEFKDENTMRRVPNYYVRQQVTRFIKPGYTMVTALSEKALAALSPQTDTLVVVLLNNSYKNALHRISLPGTEPNGKMTVYRTTEGQYMQPTTPESTTWEKGQLTVALPKLSLTTLLLPVKSMATAAPERTPGKAFLMVPQSNCSLALTVRDGKAELAKYNAQDKHQLWRIAPNGEGCLLKNNADEILTADAGYALTASKEEGKGQCFAIQPVEDYFHRIVAEDGRAFDVEKENPIPGASVGLKPYGPSVSADTRNWNLVPVE